MTANAELICRFAPERKIPRIRRDVSRIRNGHRRPKPPAASVCEGPLLCKSSTFCNGRDFSQLTNYDNRPELPREIAKGLPFAMDAACHNSQISRTDGIGIYRGRVWALPYRLSTRQR